MAGAAGAQTTAPTQPAGSGQVITQMPPDLMRGSKLVGIDVYGADNQKIGDMDELLVDRQGKIHGFVVGVGGFLGIGQKDVAIPFDQVQWLSYQEVQASLNSDQGGSGTNTASGATVPATATGGTKPPATTGSTNAGNAGSPGAAATLGGAGTAGGPTNDNTPARAVVKMTKADLQNAPAFRYANNPGQMGAAGNTNPPPQSIHTPGNTPPNAPRQ